jgi:hypothetical protein
MLQLSLEGKVYLYNLYRKAQSNCTAVAPHA